MVVVVVGGGVRHHACWSRATRQSEWDGRGPACDRNKGYGFTIAPHRTTSPGCCFRQQRKKWSADALSSGQQGGAAGGAGPPSPRRKRTKKAPNPRRSGPFHARGAHCTTIRGDQGHLVGG